MSDRRERLANKPRKLRGATALGIDSAGAPPIDEHGGNYGAGLVRGFAVVTRGEALGHGYWLDQTFLSQVASAMAASGTSGHKSRFTHPGLSSDGLAKFLGRATYGVSAGNVVRGNLHLAESAHDTPDGDLAGYVMQRAREDAASFGSSIVYAPDYDAEDEFFDANQQLVDEPDGTKRKRFRSPDPLNTKHLPHARLSELRAVDIVDDPAANPDGLFHRGDEIAAEADQLAAFALGLSAERPRTNELSIDPDRVNAFVSKFLDRHGLSVVPKNLGVPTMGDEQKEADKPAGESKPESKPADEQKPATETKPAETPESTEPKTGDESKPAEGEQLSKGQLFLQAFGDRGGRWFAEGKSYKECQALYLNEMKAENVALAAKVEALSKQVQSLRGEASPATNDTAAEGGKKFANPDMVAKVGSEGMARFAQSLTIPK